jgi:hypothetical protein
MSLFQKRLGLVLMIVSLISFVGLVLLTILTTTPLEDVAFFVQQIVAYSVGGDILVILSGSIGFIYFFMFPGLPFFINLENFEVSHDPKDFLIAAMYSGAGNYAILLFGMLVGLPLIGFAGPLILLCIIICTRGIFHDIKTSITPSSTNRISLKNFTKMFGLATLTIVGVFLVSIIIRFIIFNTNWVEYSDILVYHQQIVSIGSNNYLLNTRFTARAPLFTMFSYLFCFFTPSPLSSMKTVSFMFALVLMVPAISIVTTLTKNNKTKFLNHVFPILFLVYPWIMMMASVPLQDILLTFYVMSFVSLILLRGRKECVAAAIAAGLAFLCRYSLGILGPLGFIFLIYRDRKDGIKNSLTFLFIWAIITGSWIIRNLVVAGVPLSTTDEGLFNIASFVPGLINIIKEFGMDRHGMNTISLWIPIVLIAVIFVRSEEGREKIKSFLTRDYIFIYLVILAQIVTLSSFYSQQHRFMLSIIWFFPLIWVILADSFDVPGKYFLSLGWIIFSLAHTFNLTRIFWVFSQGRLPIEFGGPAMVIYPLPPSIVNLGAVTVSLAIIVGFCIILAIMINPMLVKDSQEIQSNP